MRVLLGAAGGAAVAFLAVGCVSAPAVTTTGTTTSSGPSSSPTALAQTATVGSTIELSGFNSGEKMAVTVVRVISRAKGADMFNTPNGGDRFYAVQFRLRDNGTVSYNDSPSNGATVVDSKGQSYQADVSDVRGCVSFPASEVIPVGGSGLGCIVFQVPKHATIASIQFTLDSGMASQTGQWRT